MKNNEVVRIAIAETSVIIRGGLTTGTCLTSHIMRTLTIFLKKQRVENTFSFQQKELTATAMLNIPTTAIFSLAKKQKACPRSF